MSPRLCMIDHRRRGPASFGGTRPAATHRRSVREAAAWTAGGAACDDPDVSTEVDAPPAGPAPDKRRRLPGRYIWLAAALVIVLGGLGAVYGLGAFGEDDLPGTAGEEGFQAQ